MAELEFLFEAPEHIDTLSLGANTARQMGALASRLATEQRTRCAHPDGRRENVAEHCLMLAKVAPELASQLYPNLDQNLVARFATIHDDVEAYVGDTPTDVPARLDPLAKELREAQGLTRLAADFAHMPTYVGLIKEYEAQSVPEARFVRATDKLMVLLIHTPNQGAQLRQHYTYDSFLESERQLMQRDAHKYGEFAEVMRLRQELAHHLADSYLR